MLAGSPVVVGLWRGKRLVGFGQAASDGRYRAMLWDIVVAGDLQGRGLGRRVVEALLEAPTLQQVERVYLMTTNSAGFATAGIQRRAASFTNPAASDKRMKRFELDPLLGKEMLYH